MPTYDFRCVNCGERFSRRVPIEERDKVRCPQCGSKAQQLLTGFIYFGKSDGGGSGSCSRSSCSGCSGC
ncbi:hypothetical protein Moth_2262 [Calderihabitans maritimus]|uniref:Putative regulatory protein FmdB zinc ribbon domain-containing protein n=1 Tax=Calderihabitans maritimus TaxID=1246530 RepID=A0A1Z5HRT4_9FIRM|nr:hypothetical protein Moth_2262 [Calderihabitans maritimus]